MPSWMRWDSESAKSMTEPTYKELVRFARWAQSLQPNALRIMQENGLVIDNLDDPMQKLAFTFYTDLCEIELKVRQLFDEV
jgi:hypothetical protein